MLCVGPVRGAAGSVSPSDTGDQPGQNRDRSPGNCETGPDKGPEEADIEHTAAFLRV